MRKGGRIKALRIEEENERCTIVYRGDSVYRRKEGRLDPLSNLNFNSFN